MKTKYFSICLSFIALCLTTNAFAAPIPYTINFNLIGGYGTLPTFGSFNYDSSDPTTGFTDFVVDYLGEEFTFDASANAPTVDLPYDCGGLTGSALGFAVMTGCLGYPQIWVNSDNEQGSFAFVSSPGGPDIFSAQLEPITFPESSGEFTVTASPAPEPSSTVLFAAVIVPAAIAARKGIFRRVCSASS